MYCCSPNGYSMKSNMYARTASLICSSYFLAHGTFIGSIRLEVDKPQHVPIDSDIHFGASTRRYVIRERPQTMQPSMGGIDEKTGEELEGGLLGLPETETELDVRHSLYLVNGQKILFPWVGSICSLFICHL